MSSGLTLEYHGAVAHLLIDRAARKNAFTQAMWETLPGLVGEAMAQPAARVLVLQSAAPGAFSAGADITEFAAGARDPDWSARNRAAVRSAQVELARAPKPTIALIEGACVGGGCGLAMACDIRIASPAARFGIPAARLGLIYSLHDTKLLVDLVGPGQARRLLFSGELIDAGEAARIGLIDILAEDASAAAADLASRIAAVSPRSVAAMKTIIRRILDGQADDDEQTLATFAEAFASSDFQDAVSAFLARRPATD